MKKHYDGLEVIKVSIESSDAIAASNCVAMVQLEMVNGICISDEWQKQITYVGNQS